MTVETPPPLAETPPPVVESPPPGTGTPQPPADAPAIAGRAPDSPWGPWATVGLSLVVLVAFNAAQAVVLLGITMVQVARDPRLDADTLVQSMMGNGLLLGLATLASTTLCTPLMVLFVRMRGTLPVARYLGLRWPGIKTCLLWILVACCCSAVADGMSYLLGRQLVPEFMKQAYGTAGFLPLLWLAVVVLAPLFEELLFRGFLLEGLRSSRLGAPASVALTSAAWAAIHLQYGIYDLTVIFLLGLVLGLARIRTRSIITPMLMHAVNNLIATVEVSVVLGSSSLAIASWFQT